MLEAVDLGLVALLDTARSPVLDRALGAITVLGSSWALALFGIVFVVALRAAGRETQARVAALSLILGLLPFLQGLKWLVGRERPAADAAMVPMPWTASFPSGHTFGVTLIVGLALWATWDSRKSPGWLLAAGGGAILAVLMGISRVYLGVHWPTDVLGGWLLAAAWLSMTAWMAGRQL